MNFHHRKREVPQLNTTSTADISFMLLIFFLVTTNMDVDKGLTRQLPPEGQQSHEESFVEKGTMLDVAVTADNRLLVDGKPMNMRRLRTRVIAFADHLGKRHLVKVTVDPAANYDTYFQMQNQLVAAYRELRNRKALALYGRPYNQLSSGERDKVKDDVPQRIAEQYIGSSATGTGEEAAAPEAGTDTQQKGVRP